MSYLSEVRTIFRHAFRVPSTRLSVANYSRVPKDDEIYNEDDEGKVNVSELLIDEEIDTVQREKEIEKMRNKSRLNKTHRNFLYNKPKPMEEYKWDHTVYFSRKQYGQYGSASGVNPRICFYTPAEIADKEEFEKVSYPHTIQEMVETLKQEKEEKATAIREREKKIAANLGKLDKWMAELSARVAKKEEETRKAKEKREQMLEDIRQEVGFKIDYKDPRFKTIMERKELEAKKAKKAEKRAKREELLIEKLKEQAEASILQSRPKEVAEDAEDADETLKKPAKKSKDTATKSKVVEKDGNDSDSDSDDEKGKQKKK